MQLCKRIIYNKLNGKILNNCLDERFDNGLTQEMLDDMRPTEIAFLDIPFGSTDNKIIISVDVINKVLVTEDIVIELTNYDKKIAELENIILESEGLV